MYTLLVLNAGFRDVISWVRPLTTSKFIIFSYHDVFIHFFFYSTAPHAQRWAATPLLPIIIISAPLPILAIIQVVVVMPYWTRVLLWKAIVKGISQKVSRAVIMTSMEGACFFVLKCVYFLSACYMIVFDPSMQFINECSWSCPLYKLVSCFSFCNMPRF